MGVQLEELVELLGARGEALEAPSPLGEIAFFLPGTSGIRCS